jgi:hypothetical protein
MPHYRIQRKLPNGWNIRLELLTYDAYLPNPITGGTITALGDVCLLELGEQTAEFDGLPYGLVKPQTLNFKLAWSMLPSAMQDYIENQVDPANDKKVNLWMLYSDRGTSGATYSLEFAGVEDNVEAVNLEPLDDMTYAYNVELVDMTFHAMKTLTGYEIFQNKAGALTTPESKAFQFLLRSLVGRNQYHQAPGMIKADTFENIVGHIRTAMNSHIEINYARRLGVTSDLFDYTTVIDDIFIAALELYTLTNLNSDPRTISTAITATTGYLVTNVYKGSVASDTIGGIYSSGDNYGWGRRDVTLYDILRDICEGCGVKASYKVDLRTTSGYDRITTTWFVKRIASSRETNADTTDATLSIDNALVLPNIVKRGDNVAKAEVRYETSNSEDSTEIVRLKKGARSSRSMNIEPIIHNVPVYLKEYDDENGRYEPMKQTNQIYFKASDNNSIVKVHETTKYWYGPKADQWIKVSSTASDKPEFQDDVSQDKYRIQLAAMQARTSMTAALCVLHLHVFADENNATAELEYNYELSEFVRPQGLCGRHSLTGNVADPGNVNYFANINWAYALPVSISMNWVAGTSKVKYYVLSPTTSKEIT